MTGIIREERIGACRLIQGDCLEIMPGLDRVDAVVTDPPYGIARDKGMGVGGSSLTGNRNNCLRRYAGGWDGTRPCDNTFAALLSSANVHIVWGGNYFSDVLPVSQKWLWWDKLQIMPSCYDGELAWTSLDGASTKKSVYNGSGLHAKEKNRVHPTQKPVALMEWCINHLPENADTILDPFMGSGTTLVACAKLGRKGIGIELDPDYFEIACKRVDEAYRQPDMFVEQPKLTPAQEGFDL